MVTPYVIVFDDNLIVASEKDPVNIMFINKLKEYCKTKSPCIIWFSSISYHHVTITNVYSDHFEFTYEQESETVICNYILIARINDIQGIGKITSVCPKTFDDLINSDMVNYELENNDNNDDDDDDDDDQGDAKLRKLPSVL